MLACLQAALDSVDARRCTARHLEARPLHGDWYVLAIGKAAGAMTAGVCDALQGRMIGALIVTKPNHVPSELAARGNVTVVESAHPVPDQRSLLAGDALAACLQGLPGSTQLLFLISGGASSLVECPVAGIGLEDLQRFNVWALGADTDIATINRLRRRLSLIKGGGLAAMLGRRRAIALMISDVPGDDPTLIGSGLLHRDPATRRPRARSRPSLPPDIDEILRRAHRQRPRRLAVKVPYRIIATIESACRAAAAHGLQRGYKVLRHRVRFAGEAAQLGSQFARAVLSATHGSLHVWGGESTVYLPERRGRGGRNQHLALSAAIEFAGHADVQLLAAATDGIDGSSEDAGALVDGDTARFGVSLGLDPTSSLVHADSGTFLEECGALVHTGPTLTNVGDLVLGLRTGMAS